MRNIFLAFVLLVLGILSCKKEKIEVPPPVLVEDLIKRAWASYDAFDFELAELRFDSALSYELDNLEALVGFGWSILQQNEYHQSIDYYSLAITKEDAFWYKRIDNEAIIDTEWIYEDTLPYIGGEGYIIQISQPLRLLYIVEIFLLSEEGGRQDLTENAYYFVDNRIYINRADIDDLLTDYVYVSYVGYDPNSGAGYSNFVKWAYAGAGYAQLAEDEFGESVVYLGSLYHYLNDTGTGLDFSHWPYLDKDNIVGGLAYSYFKDRYYGNAYDILKAYNPDFPDINPFDESKLDTLLFEIQRLFK